MQILIFLMSIISGTYLFLTGVRRGAYKPYFLHWLEAWLLAIKGGFVGFCLAEVQWGNSFLDVVAFLICSWNSHFVLRITKVWVFHLIYECIGKL
ncbi:TPA: hypothetical protein N0U02_003911 [Salmonella enterica]|uniref:hypothetical protein n=1 Tax=Salmonella enterica TaxID=28901 RepID=UPI003730A14D|nr:hypothetical protein [Salmonella enterica]MCR2330882.1 hypothetical protein [Salmonella enterica]MCR2345112.1 hypothetical protein [Salmonella enterica]MCR2350004.1 hypothetical protein [Salmonella enterica]HCK6872248.1 hypothetical protein [Salmonella enterica]